MFKEWNLELNQLLILLALGGFGGWAVGHTGWGIAAVATGYSFWMLWRTRGLVRALRSSDDTPEASGLWGIIYDHLFQQQKQHRLQVNNLHTIIARAQQSTNAIRDAVIVVDRQGNLEWWNEAGSQLLGLKIATDRGQQITNLLRDPRFVRFFNRANFDSTLRFPPRCIPASSCNTRSRRLAMASGCWWCAMSPACTTWNRCARISSPTYRMSCARRSP